MPLIDNTDYMNARFSLERLAIPNKEKTWLQAVTLTGDCLKPGSMSFPQASLVCPE